MLGTTTFLFLLTMASFTPAPVQLTAEASGSTITLHLGESVVVTLHATGGTGYRWDPEPGAESILEQQGAPAYHQDRPDPGVAGGGGSYSYTFRAARKGSGELKLIYHRPWETGVPPVQTFRVQVVVEP